MAKDLDTLELSKLAALFASQGQNYAGDNPGQQRSLAALGDSAQGSIQAEVARRQQRALEKSKKGKLGGSIGSLIGGVAGSFLPGVGTAIGAGLGSALGGTAGSALAGGDVSGMTPLQYGVQGAMMAPAMKGMGAALRPGAAGPATTGFGPSQKVPDDPGGPFNEIPGPLPTSQDRMQPDMNDMLQMMMLQQMLRSH